ncbi:MAG: tripartite tricarboxylate transporter substrate binding protein [Clostridia bacterium]|nr:tripartite tricarboxylate transporter substrate binding protein [Clostridia bacterium]
MKKTLFILMMVALVATSVFAQATAEAPKFPTKQINIVVGASAGGTSDVVTRFLAKDVETQLGVPVVVTNKPGGSCSVAFEYMAAQKPDGYNMMYMPVESAMVKPLGLTNLEPSSIRYIGLAMYLPATVTVNKNAPWNTFEELIKYAKANPGKVTVGNSGTGSIWHFAAAGIEQATGVKFNHVPFDGGAAAATAVMGGHIDVATVAPGEVLTGVQGGNLKVLAIVDNNRSVLYPNVPSFKELGYDVKILGWGAFGVPANTPDDIVKTLESAFAKAIQSQGFKDLCTKYGLTQGYLNAAEAQTFAEAQAAWYQTEIPKFKLR